MPDDKLADTIAAGRALLIDATPGPWERDSTEVHQSNAYVDGTGARVWVAHTSLEDDERGEADSALIVWMRNNIGPLLDHVETLESARDRIAELEKERDACRRAAQTWLSVVERQCRDVLDATGMHDIINESGDGDWALVWERIATMGADLRAAQARVAELEEDNAHLLNAQRDARLNGGAQ